MQCEVFQITTIENYTNWALKIITVHYFPLLLKTKYVDVVWITSNASLSSQNHVLSKENLHFAWVSTISIEYKLTNVAEPDA